MGYNWKNRSVNFDNIGSALLSIFILSTLEGWPDIMANCMDADDAESVT